MRQGCINPFRGAGSLAFYRKDLKFLSLISTVVMSRLVALLFLISKEINPKSLAGTSSK